jgi:hypothetical protein
MTKYPLVVLATIIVIAAVVFVVIILRGSSPSPIPASISSRVSFNIFYPRTDVPGIKPDNSSIDYSAANSALSFDVSVDNVKVAISEQNTPDIFSQSGVYSFKLDQAHEYSSFETASGEVDLTKPTELGGQTLAWVNTRGTFMLARAYANLSENNWKLLFNNMESY